MARQLLKNEAAEQEANDVAFKFMNSADVVGDMKRAYTGRLDRVRLHDDAAADARVSAAGRDGIASGSDIYLKKGLLSDSAPETKGLIAHEMTHIMQQSGGESTQESVSYGEEQGGIRDWFKSRFGKKKTPEELREQENQQRLQDWAGELGDEGIANLQISGPGTRVQAGIRGGGSATWYGDTGEVIQDGYNYRDFKSMELGMRVRSATPEQLASPELQQEVLEDFNTNFGAALEEKRGAGDGPANLFRAKNGALRSFNTVLGSMTAPDMGEKAFASVTPEQKQQMIDYDKRSRLYGSAVGKRSDREKMAQAGKTPAEIEQMYAYTPEETQALSAGKGAAPDSLVGVMNFIGQQAASSPAGDFMAGASSAFLDHGFTEDEFDSMMMQNYALRGGFNSQLATGGRAKESAIVQKALVDDNVTQKSTMYGTLKNLLHRKKAAAGRSRSGTVFSDASVLR